MGFEETEEIGPDGKPHIVSEKSFNPNGGKLTKAQKANQKAMQKEMKVCAASATFRRTQSIDAALSCVPAEHGKGHDAHVRGWCFLRGEGRAGSGRSKQEVGR